MEQKKAGILERIKKIRRDQWIVFLLAGVLAVLISVPAEKKQKQETQEETKASVYQNSADDITALEQHLEAILEKMEGAGRVSVMITRKDDGEKIVEKDIPVTNRTTQEEGSDGILRNTSENQSDEATVYEKSGDGSETPYVTKEIAPEIEGVLILAEGGGNAVTEKNITDAVMALFGLEAHKIKVMKMKERSA
ncbi:MAG: stage III sporulation protein AG [Eubacteriales bacterium]|nr:stage III sporulation protein AG [Eubacteriales bacterium]